MTRGNQRDLARAKNLKKQQELAKKKGSGEKGVPGASLDNRMNRDADIMRKKQEAAAAKKAADDAASAGGGAKIAKVDPLAL